MSPNEVYDLLKRGEYDLLPRLEKPPTLMLFEFPPGKDDFLHRCVVTIDETLIERQIFVSHAVTVFEKSNLIFSVFNSVFRYHQKGWRKRIRLVERILRLHRFPHAYVISLIAPALLLVFTLGMSQFIWILYFREQCSSWYFWLGKSS
jgi:hypothetical protein